MRGGVCVFLGAGCGHLFEDHLMPFPPEHYDAETRAILASALDIAWDEIERVSSVRKVNATGLRTILAIKIMADFKGGERDPDKLAKAALAAVGDLY